MSETQSSEALFHDVWAASVELSETLPVEFFEHPTSPENRFIMSQIGDVRGKRLLDIGCGLGESSVYFARLGACVTANDISPKMLDHTMRLAVAHGVSVRPFLGNIEEISIEPESFDIVYGANVLHHAQNPVRLLTRVAEILAPEGKFFFWDPLAYNPIINIYRRIATNVRTKDERPLRFSIIKRAKSIFSEVNHREFWLTTQSIFLKYFIIDRIHPNSERYWKRILREDPVSLAKWFVPLQRLDEILLCLPPFRFLAWNMVMWGRK